MQSVRSVMTRSHAIIVIIRDSNVFFFIAFATDKRNTDRQTNKLSDENTRPHLSF